MTTTAEPEPLHERPPEFTPPHFTPPDLTPLDEPAPCRTCRGPIVRTVLGWMHIDRDNTPTTWLCAGHMRLAEPDLIGLTGAETVNRQQTGAPPTPRRRPTPIPALRDASRAGASPPARSAPLPEWPLPSSDTPWWEHR